MTTFRSLLAASAGKPLLLPGAHDALSARLIEATGFVAYGIGGSALSATQLGLPDIGLQSFGEYRDAVGRIMEGSGLPVMVDGENGFGDAKAVTRTVRAFERMGVGGLALEDLMFPPLLGRPPSVIARKEMRAKLEAAISARTGGDLFLIGRTDAAYTVSLEEALARVAEFESLGVDAVLVTGLADFAAYRRLRDAVRVPILAVVVPGSPWFAPSVEDLTRLGIEAALYPAAILARMLAAMREGLESIRPLQDVPAQGTSLPGLLRVSEWTEIDRRAE
jgi:2-methylisocitrate lyase-like PEP mutase family enzyme